jgi:hypothetical protein
MYIPAWAWPHRRQSCSSAPPANSKQTTTQPDWAYACCQVWWSTSCCNTNQTCRVEKLSNTQPVVPTPGPEGLMERKQQTTNICKCVRAQCSHICTYIN